MHQDLIEQAKSLAELDDRGAPKQANLRRAVSAAYYALFHFLVDQACRAIVGTQHNQQGFRHALARGFVHTTMKSACGSFSATQLPDTVVKSLPKNPDGKYLIPDKIKQISTLFKELQQKRHLADYDLSERFRRSEVLSLIQQVAQHIEAFTTLPLSDDRQFFLICLLSWKELANR
jgi:uncharacterized protein (UPF0332 family)